MTHVLDRLLEKINAERGGGNPRADDMDPEPGGGEVETRCCGLASPAGPSARTAGQCRFTVHSTVTLIYGSPGKGKSYLLNRMYEDPPRRGPSAGLIKTVLIFTPTPDDWPEAVQQRSVRAWSETTLARFMQYCAKERAAGQKVLIIDDLLSVVNFDSQVMVELMTRHRHYNISVVISCQNVSKKIHPLVRGQVGRFVCFDPQSLEACEVLFRAFCGGIWMNAKDMYTKIKEMDLARDHSYIIVDVVEGTYTVGNG